MNAKTKKAKATQQKLFEAAVRLFSAKGFEGTTMRAIADEAGLATGAAYYYFKSKDDVVQRLYQETLDGDDHVVRTLLRRDEQLERVIGYVEWKIDRLAPYHGAVGALVGRILTPRTGLSPFGDEQRALRERDIANFSALISVPESADIDEAARKHRVRALWALWMTVLFFWLHDERDDRNGFASARFRAAAKPLLELPDALIVMGASMLGPLWRDTTGDGSSVSGPPSA